jgi:hypothetical protein
MLKPVPYCECGKPATRFAVDRWPYRDGLYRTLALCPHCPSPSEIDQRAAKVREGWSDQEFYAKHYGVALSHLEYHRGVDIAIVRVMDDE